MPPRMLGHVLSDQPLQDLSQPASKVGAYGQGRGYDRGYGGGRFGGRGAIAGVRQPLGEVADMLNQQQQQPSPAHIAQERDRYIEKYDFPYCARVDKYEKISKIALGTFGEVF